MRISGIDELEREREEAEWRRDDGKNTPAPPVLRAVDVRELLELEIPAREYLLEPIVREKESLLVHSWRGVGKTFFGLELAFAVASGGSFLKWRAPRPRRVLYVDGEMPARVMQERIAAIVKASDRADDFEPHNLRLVCADLQDTPLPNLSTLGGQMLLEPLVEEADLLLVDSISTLADYGRENEAESWAPMQEWTLQQRRRGKSVILLHHDGKHGLQRGTSRREDVLDLVIGLRRPPDYVASEGARFEIHFEKARALCGEEVKPFEARLELLEGRAVWTTRDLEDADLSRVADLLNEGVSIRDAAEELGMHKSRVERLKKKAAAAGKLR